MPERSVYEMRNRKLVSFKGKVPKYEVAARRTGFSREMS